MIMDVGRVCRKVSGKEAGKYCVILDRMDKNFVLVDGDGLKRKRVNIKHLEPLPVTLDVSKSTKTKDVVSALNSKSLAK